MISKNYAMALSGGGYRALLFCLGSLWRLNEFGLLAQLNRITSVSGGSITSAYLAMKWSKLDFDPSTHIASNFREIIAEPLQEFSSHGLDIMAGITGILSPWKSIGDRVAEIYDKHLFKSATLQDIPTPELGPEFIFYATSFQTGSSVQITKASLFDYKIGSLPGPELLLAQVVGASSAFPPLLSPVRIKTDPAKWIKTPNATLYKNIKFRKKMILTDGGVYDNLGLEAVWNDGFKNVFVCDASAPFKAKESPCKNWFSQSLRILDITTEQTRALRRRTLINNYQKIDANGNHLEYNGVFIGIKTKIDIYGLDNAMVKDNEIKRPLKDIRTRLNHFSREEQGELINWGYALTDAALRRWYFTTRQEPGRWPISEYALNRK